MMYAKKSWFEKPKSDTEVDNWGGVDCSSCSKQFRGNLGHKKDHQRRIRTRMDDFEKLLMFKKRVERDAYALSEFFPTQHVKYLFLSVFETGVSGSSLQGG